MRQTIDDVDVIDLLDVGDGEGGVRVGGAELGLVEGGNQPGAVERREMFGQHPVQSVQSGPGSWDKTPLNLTTTRLSENSYCVCCSQVETFLVINETQLSVNHLLKC